MCTIDPHLLLTSLTNTCFSLLFYLLLLSLAWSPNNNNNTMHHWSPLQPITNLQTQICTNQNQDLSFVSTYLSISFYLFSHRNEYLFFSMQHGKKCCWWIGKLLFFCYFVTCCIKNSILQYALQLMWDIQGVFLPCQTCFKNFRSYSVKHYGTLCKISISAIVQQIVSVEMNIEHSLSLACCTPTNIRMKYIDWWWKGMMSEWAVHL